MGVVMCLWRHLQEDKVGPGRQAPLEVAVVLALLVALVAKVTTELRDKLEGLGPQVRANKYFNSNDNNNLFLYIRVKQSNRYNCSVTFII